MCMIILDSFPGTNRPHALPSDDRHLRSSSWTTQAAPSSKFLSAHQPYAIFTKQLSLIQERPISQPPQQTKPVFIFLRISPASPGFFSAEVYTDPAPPRSHLSLLRPAQPASQLPRVARSRGNAFQGQPTATGGYVSQPLHFRNGLTLDLHL